MTPPKTRIDRPQLIRRALVELVAGHGFRGTSMAAVAEQAGVATGTAYVHYQSKDALVVAAFYEVKAAIAAAAGSAVSVATTPEDRFHDIWLAVYRYLAADPAQAKFLMQFEASPYAADAHAEYAEETDDELMQAAMADDMAEALVDLPVDVLFDLGLGPAVRLAASGTQLDGEALETLVAACWRAVTRP
jgi:AcrR family transcriptional regulator